MKNQEIANLIQEHFKLVSTPSESEVSFILQQISATTTANEFEKIVLDNLSNTKCVSNESLEMSASLSLLKQIKNSLGKK